MNRIIILILLISFSTCKAQEKNCITKSENLYKINNYIVLGKGDKQLYSKLDSLKKIIDGADAELYLEIYKNAIIYDTDNFKKHYLKNQLDEDVICYFSQSEKTLDSINYSINKIYPRFLFINDQDGFVNMRKEPNVKSEIILKINSNKRVNVIDRSRKWTKIYYNGNIGYIHTSRLSDKINNWATRLRNKIWSINLAFWCFRKYCGCIPNPNLHLEIVTVQDPYSRRRHYRTNPTRFIKLNSYNTEDQDDASKKRHYPS